MQLNSLSIFLIGLFNIFVCILVGITVRYFFILPSCILLLGLILLSFVFSPSTSVFLPYNICHAYTVCNKSPTSFMKFIQYHLPHSYAWPSPIGQSMGKNHSKYISKLKIPFKLIKRKVNEFFFKYKFITI